MDLVELKKVQPKGFNRHPWEQARLKVVLSFLKKISLKKRIIDIGSGDAYIAKGIAKAFPETSVAAVDVNYSEQIKNNLKRTKLNNIVFANSVNILKEQVEAPVSIIVLMDVIEHIEDPFLFLKEVVQMDAVSTSTQFLITVPAFQSLYTNHDRFLGHYRRYNLNELKELLESAHMEIQYSGYFFNSLLLLRAFQKIINKRYDYGLHNWKGNKFITSLITKFFWIEFKISWYLSQFRIYLPGLTCYCLCHPLP